MQGGGGSNLASVVTPLFASLTNVLVRSFELRASILDDLTKCGQLGPRIYAYVRSRLGGSFTFNRNGIPKEAKHCLCFCIFLWNRKRMTSFPLSARGCGKRDNCVFWLVGVLLVSPGAAPHLIHRMQFHKTSNFKQMATNCDCC